MSEKRFSWEYSHYDSTGEIHDWKRKECLITDYLQKYEIVEWCQELNKIVDENEQLKQQNADWETSLDICKHNKETYGTEIVKIKQTIKTMMENERTELGRSVLRQLWEAIQ